MQEFLFFQYLKTAYWEKGVVLETISFGPDGTQFIFL